MYSGFWSLCDLVHLYDSPNQSEYVGMWNGAAFEGTMSNVNKALGRSC